MTDPNVIISTFINKLNPILHLFMRVHGGNEETKEAQNNDILGEKKQF